MHGADESARIARILVPLDPDRQSDRMVAVAARHARAFGARLILLNVLPPTSSSRLSPLSPAEEDDNPRPDEPQAIAYLGAVATRLRSEGVEASPLLRFGQAAEVILDEVRRQAVDLVIVGSSVRPRVSRLLLGSVAEEVVARADCPVLLVRTEARPDVTPGQVRDFAEDLARVGPCSPRHIGLRTVEIARVVGSVGRSRELDESFRIRRPSRIERQRYERVLRAMSRGDPLPPIVVNELGFGYYVVDGHHRVAAAREIGQEEIEAEVTEYVPLGDPLAQRVFRERRAFERATGLTRIAAARPGTYPRLEAMIRSFAAERQLASLREAARRWEAEVYRPAARAIRAHRLRERYPGELTADVLLRVADAVEERRDEKAAGRGSRVSDAWREAVSWLAAGSTRLRGTSEAEPPELG